MLVAFSRFELIKTDSCYRQTRHMHTRHADIPFERTAILDHSTSYPCRYHIYQRRVKEQTKNMRARRQQSNELLVVVENNELG